MGEPKNVKKLAADAQRRKAAQTRKETKRQPTAAGKIRLRKAVPPTPKGKPNAVLKLIADALDRKGKR